MIITAKKMSQIYSILKTKGMDTDDLLRFNYELCLYCTYGSNKGACHNIDLKHLKSMPFVKEKEAYLKIIEKMEDYSIGHAEYWFFIQKEISPFSFEA